MLVNNWLIIICLLDIMNLWIQESKNATDLLDDLSGEFRDIFMQNKDQINKCIDRYIDNVIEVLLSKYNNVYDDLLFKDKKDLSWNILITNIQDILKYKDINWNYIHQYIWLCFYRKILTTNRLDRFFIMQMMANMIVYDIDKCDILRYCCDDIDQYLYIQFKKCVDFHIYNTNFSSLKQRLLALVKESFCMCVLTREDFYMETKNVLVVCLTRELNNYYGVYQNMYNLLLQILDELQNDSSEIYKMCE